MYLRSLCVLNVIFCILLANCRKKSTKKRTTGTRRPFCTLDNIVRCSNKDFDVAETLLSIASTVRKQLRRKNRNVSPQVDLAKCRQVMDQLTRQVSEAVKHVRGSPKRLVESVKKSLIKQFKYSSIGCSDKILGKHPDYVLFDSVLVNRTGVCSSMTLAFYSVLSRLRLPFYTVVYPGHWFLRYDDGVAYHNIENSGAVGRNESYKEFPLYKNTSYYFSDLDKKEVVALYLIDLALVLASNNMRRKAWTLVEVASALTPRYGDGYYRKGLWLRKQGAFRGATSAFKKATSIEPDNYWLELELGRTYLAHNGDVIKALPHLRKAFTLGANHETCKMLCMAIAANGNRERAVQVCRRCRGVDKKQFEAFCREANEMASEIKRERLDEKGLAKMALSEGLKTTGSALAVLLKMWKESSETCRLLGVEVPK